MSCCCTNIYKFCSPVNTCNSDTFKAMFTGLDDGAYTIQLNFLDSVVSVAITVASGVVTIPNPLTLNEKYTYVANVLNDAGFAVTLFYNTVAYDCIQFNTKL